MRENESGANLALRAVPAPYRFLSNLFETDFGSGQDSGFAKESGLAASGAPAFHRFEQ
jgi:hypothetical protein